MKMRKAAMEGMRGKVGGAAAAVTGEPESITEAEGECSGVALDPPEGSGVAPDPPKAGKRKDTETLDFLRAKYQCESDLRQQELDLQKERLELEKEKLQVEKEERAKRFELEREERLAMIDLLKKKL